MSYWRGYSRSPGHHVSGITADEGLRADGINSAAFEDEPADKELGVQLNNVSKVNNKTNK